MNKTEAERVLASARAELESMRDRYEALERVVSGLEQWLGLEAPPPKSLAKPATAKPASPAVKTTATVKPSASAKPETPSIRLAVADVLREARAPLHVGAIYERAKAKGMNTTAAKPLGIIDLTLFGLVKRGQAERVGPRTYVWKG